MIQMANLSYMQRERERYDGFTLIRTIGVKERACYKIIIIFMHQIYIYIYIYHHSQYILIT